MSTRPFSVTVIAWALIAAGAVGVIKSLLSPFDQHAAWSGGVNLLGIVGGCFLLRGRNWARWLSLAWIGAHVILGSLHSLPKTIVHVLLLAVIGWVLFRPRSNAYFARNVECRNQNVEREE